MSLFAPARLLDNGAKARRNSESSPSSQLVPDVYNWFTEGFDTKDLQEAKVLLEELA